MQKLRLDLDEVQVNSFVIETLEADEGTVHGMSGLGCDSFDCYSATNTPECPCQRQYTNEYEC